MFSSRTMLNIVKGLAVSAALALGSVGAANATPMRLFLSVTNTTTSMTTTQVYTDMGTPGTIDIVGPFSIGGIDVTGEVANTFPAPLNILSSGASTVTNNSSDTYILSAVLSEQNFTGPSASVQLSGSGTWTDNPGGVMNLSWYADPTNTLGASAIGDTPGTLLDSFASAPAGFPTDSYSYTSGMGFNDPSTAFSLTLAWNYTLSPGASLTSRGQAVASPVPEPSTVLLLGTGLLLLGFAVQRRRNWKF